MKIYYEDNHVIVIDKPVNQPSQQDASFHLDTLTMVKDYIKETYNKPGNVYVGLVHRLDRPVGGLMVFAKTSKAASRLSDQVRTRTLEKEYIAIVEGEMPLGTYTDWLIKDGNTNTSKVTHKDKKNAKQATLTVLESDYNKKENLSRVRIKLETGRHHQIRVQCASRNHPLWGDARYNPRSKPGQQIALWSYKLSFMHPTKKEKITLTSELPTSYPFNLWK
ncbi:RNA pseudouridine synthase [Erysipelothrix larvae]|uniref:RNA pseudouridylate synthase n=1 Tax=Erysipelothrix larvae TaxID=1514105 RepID=A0A109UGG9_9FIRM|nr:RluA family pseudouridine synthase [Erysipelothrix larvae]AMC92640.1 RNA pseudouridine synthase [Erysipelothrix larvae]